MPDFAAIARQSTRGQFLAAFPFPFLVGTTPFAKSRESVNTAGLLDDLQEEGSQKITATNLDSRTLLGRDKPQEKHLTVLGVRKMMTTSLDMITLGRTSRNDMVLEYAEISGLHAFFRHERGFVLADAGSRNGTWVSGRLLVPHGPPSPVLASGESVRFAQLEFTFMSPAACWDVLRVTTA